MNACPKGAISFVDRKAQIDKSKCVECGRCLSACSYSAIAKHTRPCVNACKSKAIKIDPKNQRAVINEEKCISCGACVYQCPFGAISDKSYITNAIKFIRESENNTKYKVYAIVAPSIASQYDSFPKITTEKVVSAIKQLGFYSVVEAALGADIVAYFEAKECQKKSL
jgi:Fe-S-cluster-containing hydrogenase component 2